MIKLKELLESEHRDSLVIFESPLRLNISFNPNDINSLGKNYTFTIAVKEKGKCIGKFKEYDIYEYYGKDTIYNMLVQDDAYTVAFFEYKIINNIVEESRIWQSSTNIGLCREFMFDYFLKKYDGILSDDAHTELGQKYWDKLLKEALKRGYKIFVLHNEEKIPMELPVDIEQFYFNSPKGLDYRFLLLK